jgi:hypothetical protein
MAKTICILCTAYVVFVMTVVPERIACIRKERDTSFGPVLVAVWYPPMLLFSRLHLIRNGYERCVRRVYGRRVSERAMIRVAVYCQENGISSAALWNSEFE